MTCKQILWHSVLTWFVRFCLLSRLSYKAITMWLIALIALSCFCNLPPLSFWSLERPHSFDEIYKTGAFPWFWINYWTRVCWADIYLKSASYCIICWFLLSFKNHTFPGDHEGTGDDRLALSFACRHRGPVLRETRDLWCHWVRLRERISPPTAQSCPLSAQMELLRGYRMILKQRATGLL